LISAFLARRLAASAALISLIRRFPPRLASRREHRQHRVDDPLRQSLVERAAAQQPPGGDRPEEPLVSGRDVGVRACVAAGVAARLGAAPAWPSRARAAPAARRSRVASSIAFSLRALRAAAGCRAEGVAVIM